MGELVCLDIPESLCAVAEQLRRADYMQGTRMSFRTREDAVHFAEKQGAYISLLLASLHNSR